MADRASTRVRESVAAVLDSPDGGVSDWYCVDLAGDARPVSGGAHGRRCVDRCQRRHGARATRRVQIHRPRRCIAGVTWSSLALPLLRSCSRGWRCPRRAQIIVAAILLPFGFLWFYTDWAERPARVERLKAKAGPKGDSAGRTAGRIAGKSYVAARDVDQEEGRLARRSRASTPTCVRRLCSWRLNDPYLIWPSSSPPGMNSNVVNSCPAKCWPT